MPRDRRFPAPGGPRPEPFFDVGLQHERTALAWERTAIASMVAGVLLARYAASSLHPALAAIGLAQVVFGAVLLVWAAAQYDELHGPLRAGASPVRPTAARVVGLGAVVFTAASTAIALAIAVT